MSDRELPGKSETGELPAGRQYTRARFTDQFAFVMAAAASAVGLGNLWRFPYLAAKYGGGAFLLVYLILVLTFGFTLMLSEVAIGRRTGMSAIRAFKAIRPKFAFVGVIESLAPIIIISFYCVIGGWILKYLSLSVTGNLGLALEPAYFASFTAQPVEPLLWCAAFAIMTMAIVTAGVKSGIERLNKVLMPALIIISVLLSLYVIMQPGALDGLAYYLIPDMDSFGWGTIVAAMGQMFFSMSLASGVMITYGSYMGRDDNLEKSVGQIEFFDTLVAFLAGLIIVPSVFVFSGGQASAVNAGPSLVFITLPQVFASLPFGDIIGALFFVLVFFAAVTSSVSMAEAVVSILCDHFRWFRRRALIVVWVGLLVLSIPPSLGFGIWSGVTINGLTILDMMDFCASSVFMPLGALFTCIMIGWVVGPKFIFDEVEKSQKFNRKKVFVVVVRYIAPVFLVVILASSILNALGFIVI